MTYSDDELFRFEKTIDGYTLAEYCQKENKEITEIIIPLKYNDRFVVDIGAWAFENAEHLESVKLPDSVRAISRGAFSDAYQLERVNIPKGVTEIADFAFKNCFGLRHIEIPDGVVKIGQFGFADSSLKTVVLPKSLEFLGDCAFENGIYLENVIFNSVPVFGRQVFKGCEHLPADITLMGLVNSYDITQP
ncbi:MAG: leucine-rich repeat domain-containing protein, partial [Oscillospiraceae bacterium]|nr:leucine-rich repeat domain-containing protein [Oscillospiraceae bacterium]